jgi:hypothetical protein
MLAIRTEWIATCKETGPGSISKKGGQMAEQEKQDAKQEQKPEKETGLYRRWLSFLPRLWTNWITLAGAVITTLAGCTILLVLAVEWVSPTSNMYASALGFLVMPFVFVCGLLLIPLGFFWERRRKKRDAPPSPIQEAFRAALRDRASRRRLFFVAALTFANIVIVGAAGHRAMVFMDSPEFCGTMCHQVMAPEYNAYLKSPHSRVACVDCHIGPGASWAVKSKLDGLRQVWGVIFDSFHRPIPSPVRELRPARDTCEQCHWPAKFHGSRLTFYTHYQDDEKNSPLVNALLLNVGGEDPRTGAFRGIHWHVSPEVEVRYRALDEAREKIGRIEVRKKGTLSSVYEPKEKVDPAREERIMDCVDCHNRPTHIFDPSPSLALDRALREGRLDPAIPFLKKVAAQVLGIEDLDREGAEAVFQKEMQRIYKEAHPDVVVSAEQFGTAARTLAELYRANIYPEMKIGWDTYPSHLGHRGEEEDRRGCFRCHDDEHAREDGETLSMDCDLCHQILHQDESPEEIPESLRTLLTTLE